MDYLAETARPETSDFGNQATRLAQQLPVLLTRLLAENPDRWTAFSQGAIRYHADEQSTWDIGYDPETGRIQMLRRSGKDDNGDDQYNGNDRVFLPHSLRSQYSRRVIL